jgi:hypothetical protein
MKLITKEIQKKLNSNLNIDEDKRKPYLKLFSPCGGATWLISEHNKETGLMFGLCDLGMGFVELGYVRLDELKAIKLPFGLTIERDTSWKPKMTLNEYNDAVIEKSGYGNQTLMSVMYQG